MNADVLNAPIVEYPDSDGERMADNTLQFDWIAILKWNAEGYYRDDPNVFVAGDHLIYPVEGDPSIRQAPDVYIAYGRPKGKRGSYRVWEEDGLFPQVIFEVWSPGNRTRKMETKRAFYERFGAEEYYIIFPEGPAGVEGWKLVDGRFQAIEDMNDYVSPRLGWRFSVGDFHFEIYGPDGRLLRRPDEIVAERDAAERREQEAREREREAREREREARDRAEAFAAKLWELGVDPTSI